MSKLYYLKKRSVLKNLEFDLDELWLNSKLNEKNCELSNIPFDHDKGIWYTHSIDRIDNNQGYTKNNCRVILWGLNVGKGSNCSDEELYRIAKAFVIKFEDKNK